MKSKLIHSLSLVMIFILAMLVFSQFIWLQRQMEQEKQAFTSKLESSLQSIVNFHALQGYSTPNPQKPNTATIVIEKTTKEADKDTSHQLGRMEISTDKYVQQFSLYKALEAAFTDISLAKKKIQVKVIDSLFQHNFLELEYIKFYDMQLSKNGKIIDALSQEETKDKIWKDSPGTIHIEIPLGTKEIYVFSANFRLKTLPFLRLMLYSLSISGLAVILVALFMLWLLLKLQQKVSQLQWREQVVSGIVHDLKSPLSYTYTFLDYLACKEQSSNMQKQLNNASSNISKLTHKIELILTIFRSNNKAIVMRPALYNLEQRSKDLLSELQIIYSNKQTKCTVSIPKNLNINVDPLYFEMALRNILDNAFKYSDPSVNLNITVKKDQKEIHIKITDSGKGIPQKEQKKIFQEFYRTDHETKGHGIGLSFSLQIIKAHKGRIELQSKIGRGSTFSIILPLKHVVVTENKKNGAVESNIYR